MTDPGVVANLGCPESTDLLGIVSLSGGCTITGLTTWGNGTIYIPGDLTLDAPLTLYNVHIRFEMTLNQEYGLNVYSDFAMHGGSIASTDSAYHWKGASSSGATMYIDGAVLKNGQNLRFDAAEQTVINSYINESTNPAPSISFFWLGPNSVFINNSFNDVLVSDQAAIVLWRNYGNTKIVGNQLSLDCNGNNCMGIMIRDMHTDLTPLYPGFPVVELAWNEIVFEDIAAGSNVHPTDHEYSMRIYEHNNTVINGDPQGDPLTEGLQMGGPLDSVFENNTYDGPMRWGFYHYIYGAGNNLIQYNHFSDSEWTGILQTGGNTYRHNTFANTERGLWICPDAPCAGANTNPVNNAYYNNTHLYRTGSNQIARVDTVGTDASALQNIHIAYGREALNTYLDDNGGVTRTTLGQGPVLYWGNAPIDRLSFLNHSDGSREVVMTVAAVEYNSVNSTYGAVGELALTVAGPINQTGSMNLGNDGRGTFLWSLGKPETSFDLLSLGGLTSFEVTGFFPSTSYDVTIFDHDTSASETATLVTDESGAGSTSKSLSAHHYTVTMTATSEEGGGDSTPPAAVTDLALVATGTTYAILEWTAPGDDGAEGQASSYEIRYSASGPLNDSNFASGTAIPPPSPGPAGTLEELNVTGLSPETEYWFALRTADEVPNWSPVSNSPSGTTASDGNDSDTGSDTQPPSVRFLSPSSGQVVYGDVDVSMEASDNVGISEVTLWVDDVQAASFTAAPYQWTWSTSGLAAGSYRLLATATDEAGNEARDAISVSVWAPGDLSSPQVESVQYSPSESTVEVQFSKSMNASSVADALSFRPSLAHALEWTDPAHLVIVLLERPATQAVYELTIAILARDLDGRPLATPMTVGLVVPASPSGTPFYLNPWLWAIGLLAVWWLVTLAKYRRSQNRLARLEAAGRMDAQTEPRPRPRDREPFGFGPR